MSSPYTDSCKGKAFAVLFFVFVSGMAAGALGLKVYQRRMAAADGARDSLVQHSHQPSLAVEHLRKELELDENQFTQVQSVLDECIMKEADLLTELVLTRTNGRERIRKILRNEQRQRFEELLARAASSRQE